jgi:hypothetical protein
MYRKQDLARLNWRFFFTSRSGDNKLDGGNGTILFSSACDRDRRLTRATRSLPIGLDPFLACILPRGLKFARNVASFTEVHFIWRLPAKR